MRQKYPLKLGIIGGLIIAVFLVLNRSAVPFARGDGDSDNGLYDKLEEQAKTIELKSDPFTAIPITDGPGLQSASPLTGIIWDKDKPLAIIDNNVVKIGEQVGDKTVVDIKRDRVIFSDGKALSEIRLEH